MESGGHAGPRQLRRLVEAMVGLGADLDISVVLQRIVDAAVDLVDATYGALGVLDPTGTYLSNFVTTGLDEDQRAAIGELPKGHGILGLLIVDPKPLRLPDLGEHPDSFGFPPNHPPMKSFLGVPLYVRGEVFGNLYLTDKRGSEVFTDVDEELAVGLAAAAAVAIDNARMHTRLQDLVLIEDRERIARDLHDTVIQRLFATGLSLQASARLTDDSQLHDRLQLAVDDLDVTVREIRSAIFELQAPAPARSGGVRRTLLELGAEFTDALGGEPSFRFDGPVDASMTDDLAHHLQAAVREGLSNAARHAGPGPVEVSITVAGGWLELRVDDHGAGPGPRRAGGHGLDNLASRAASLGGAATLAARDDGGARLTWRVPTSPTVPD